MQQVESISGDVGR